jgi:lipoprotein NlpI
MALAIKPNYADAWNSRGVALVEPGQDASNASCDKGLAINPDYASACFIRGVKPGIR